VFCFVLLRFFIDTRKFDAAKYFESSIITARVRHAEDPLTTVPWGKILIKMYVMREDRAKIFKSSLNNVSFVYLDSLASICWLKV
jgi:hypothetical protein